MPDHATLKLWHVAFAALSLLLFAARGAGSLVRPAWRPSGAARIVPHVVDTLLLALGAVLAWQLGAAATRGWLGAKLVAVVVYIAIGSAAMSRGRTVPVRAAAFAAALAVYGYIASVAITRSPTGFLTLP